MNRIEINHVTKYYGKVAALKNASLSFDHGKIYGLLGRNGAGKSTLINIIVNRIFAQEGDVTIDGHPAKENIGVQEKIYCMSESDLYDPHMRVAQHFRWTSRFYDNFDLDKAFAIAAKFNLDTGKKVKALSKGYKSIFKLAIALALDVPYLIFDEPVLGLDANHRELFYDLLLKDYEANPRTIILATHLIEEVANIVEEVVLIDQGEILLQETVETLLQNGYSVSGMAEDVDAFCQGKNIIGQDDLGRLQLAYILGERTPLPPNSNLHISGMNLQKLFVKLTEKGGI
ncbi:MAG: ABC transporter ATP-binding protein [Anaerovoracaceae bacterium]|jgi:ABC-2 type transport system ATP-binding protein